MSWIVYVLIQSSSLIQSAPQPILTTDNIILHQPLPLTLELMNLVIPLRSLSSSDQYMFKTTKQHLGELTWLQFFFFSFLYTCICVQ